MRGSFIRTHSQRETWVAPRPTGLLTARVLGNGGSALPRVSTRGDVCWKGGGGHSLPLSSSSVSCLLGLRVSFHSGSSQQSPALWLRLAPSATPRCFPMSDARRVYVVDSFIACDPQLHAHTKLLIPHFVWSHLQWLASCSYSNGRRPSPSLHLLDIRT